MASLSDFLKLIIIKTEKDINIIENILSFTDLDTKSDDFVCLFHTLMISCSTSQETQFLSTSYGENKSISRSKVCTEFFSCFLCQILLLIVYNQAINCTESSSSSASLPSSALSSVEPTSEGAQEATNVCSSFIY